MALDLEAIHYGAAGLLEASPVAADFNIAAFPSAETMSPKIEILPGNQNGDYIGYFGSFGPNGVSDVMVTIRVTLVGLKSEDIARWVWKLLSAGDDEGGNPQSLSISDIMLADPTLGGTVQTCRLLTARWDEDADEITIPVDIVAKKSGAQA